MNKQTIRFDAYEFHADGVFRLASYEYIGSTATGWEIKRNNKTLLLLEPGYLLLKTLICGICSTDIARASLPFDLPQITGHELVALYKNKPVIVEINASHLAINHNEIDCEYCQRGWQNHCPDRLTLGIDRLPGGFSPYVLAPQYSVIELPGNFSLKTASIMEPFAAALHAVTSEKLYDGQKIAIVGPRRLGALLILALKLIRLQKNMNFSITAIIQNEKLIQLCKTAGADNVVMPADTSKYDLVFDTSGSVSGFKRALSLTSDIVHLKSTNGKSIDGLKNFTRMVINEGQLSGSIEELMKHIAGQHRGRILLDRKVMAAISNLVGINNNTDEPAVVEFDLNDSENLQHLDNQKFDAVGVSSLSQLNHIMSDKSHQLLLNPKTRIFWVNLNDENDSDLTSALFEQSIKIHSSRCGDFRAALALATQYQADVNNFIEMFISDVINVNEINKAFTAAINDKEKIKILICHD